MQNKKLLYILLPAVLIVWGLIAYKIVKGLRKDDIYQSRSFVPATKQTGKDSAVFQLLENYRDPFLGTTVINENTGSSKKVTKDKKSESVDLLTVQQANEMWTQVNYGGLIEGKKQKEILGLLSIRGKSYLLHQGQMIDNIEIVILHADSVRLSFKGQSKTILKKK